MKIADALSVWRKMIFERVFSVLSLICFPVYITSVYLCIDSSLWELAVFDTVVYCLVLLITFTRIFSTRVRFILGCAISYAIGIAFLVAIGPSGAGFFWLFISPILASLLLGSFAGYFCQLINLLSLMVIGLLFHYQMLNWPATEGYSAFIWFVVAINFLATNLLATFMCGYLLSITAKNLQQSRQSQYALAAGLATGAELNNPHIHPHIQRIANYCQLVCQQMMDNQTFVGDIHATYIDDLAVASMLHDIGMQHVSDELVWQPHSLSLDDYEDVKRHTVLGAQMIKQLDFYHKSSQFLTTAKEIALHHHENWDGSGYPNNISGELIPLSARIMRLVDVYDGMTSERCYKKAVDHQQALVFITEKSGLLFDPNVVTAFMQVEAKFKLLHSAVEIK